MSAVALFDGLSLARLSWLSVIVYVLHYAEEGPRLVEWFRDHYPTRGLTYDQRKLNLENILLFGFNLLVVVMINIYPESAVLQILTLGSAVGFLGNTLFHALPTLRTGIYSPGVVSASMLNPALFFAYLGKAQQAGLLTWWNVAAAIGAGLAGLPLFVLLTHRVLLVKETRAPNWLEWFPVRAKQASPRPRHRAG